MRLACSLFVVAPLWVLSSWGWMTEKCFVYDQTVDIILPSIVTIMKCPQSSLTGRCKNISNVTLDLAMVPPQVQVLCLQVVKGSVLRPDELSRFQSLRSLYIQGCLSAIFPGAFKGLVNLHTLSLHSRTLLCCNSSFLADIFSDLIKLEDLSFQYYRLSSMAPDVFTGLQHLKKLEILSCVLELSEVLCRIVNITSSLTTLRVNSEHVNSLKHQNCTFLNITVNPDFYGLEVVDFYFSNVKVIYKNVFKCFKSFSRLIIPLNDVLKSQLLQSGIRKVDTIEVSHTEADFELICEIVFQLSVAYYDLTFLDFKNYTTSALKQCMSLKGMTLYVEGSLFTSKYVDLSFIHVLRNLAVLRVYGNVFNSPLEKKEFSFLCKTQSDPVTWLNKVTLSKNEYYTAISSTQFSCLGNLEQLDLTHNFISTIEDFAFKNLGRLRVLVLSYNKISEVKTYTFCGLSSLESLNLEANPLKRIEASSFIHLISLQTVSLGDLVELNLTHVFGGFPQGLTYLGISSGGYSLYLTIGSDITPKLGFTFHVLGGTVMFLDCERPFFDFVIKLIANTDDLLCKFEFIGRYFKSIEHFEISSPGRTWGLGLKDLNRFVHLTSLTLRGIDLSQQRDLNIMFHNLTRLETLILSRCLITSLDIGISKDLQSLRALYLDIESPFSLMESFPQPLTNLRYLIMSHPELNCTCDNVWINKWAKHQHQIQVTVVGLELENITCENEAGIQNFQQYAKAHCFHLEFQLFVSTSLGLLLFLLVVLLHHLAREYLLAFLHIARGWMWGVMRRNNRERYRYDAFVSYSGRDERWVVEELLPNLERRGPPFLRLCLHSRDFQLGRDIVENIMDSLYSSRRTLCLVSRHFLQSHWCSLEMRLATYRLLAEHRDILILVFLEEIPPHQLSAHHKLARLVKTRTYIDWPEDPREHAAFWDRLWAKLAPDIDEYNNL